MIKLCPTSFKHLSRCLIEKEPEKKMCAQKRDDEQSKKERQKAY